jgi:hypothetical protein
VKLFAQDPDQRGFGVGHHLGWVLVYKELFFQHTQILLGEDRLQPFLRQRPFNPLGRVKDRFPFQAKFFGGAFFGPVKRFWGLGRLQAPLHRAENPVD